MGLGTDLRPEGSMGIADQYDKNNQFLMDKFVGAPTPTMVERKSTLEKLQNENSSRLFSEIRSRHSINLSKIGRSSAVSKSHKKSMIGTPATEEVAVEERRDVEKPSFPCFFLYREEEDIHENRKMSERAAPPSHDVAGLDFIIIFSYIPMAGLDRFSKIYSGQRAVR